MQTIDALMRSVPVIPVLVIEDAAHALPTTLDGRLVGTLLAAARRLAGARR